nr:ribonuclease H-like domain-containing protein [Tanacetum cinerariifolium]
MSNPHKNWLVQKQMALGKDSSNPLMADNLPKIIWYSTHNVTLMKSWLVQKQMALGQTATGKEISNLFMAGSLPKTILITFIHGRMIAKIDKDDAVVLMDEKEEEKKVEKAKIDKIIEFGDSYKAPPEETGKGSASESSAKKKGRTVVITTEDMQKRRNDVKARTTLLLAIPDEHQLRFSKYETAKELWEAILKTFGGNEATKKTKKNQLKLQYGNFKAEEVFDKSCTKMANVYIVWRNRDDLDTISPDDVYNHLKVYEPEVQKKSESNSQNMAFISSSNTSSRKGEVLTASVPTASIQVSTASTDVAAASLSHDTVCGAPRSQDRGKRESYKQGPKEEEPTLKALMAIDDIGWDWSYMADEEENHALVADDEVPTEFALMAKSRSSSENEGNPQNNIDDKGY